MVNIIAQMKNLAFIFAPIFYYVGRFFLASDLSNKKAFLLSLVPSLFYKILYMSIIATVIGSVIIIVRKFLHTKISPKWISIFWILFILALIVPIKIESPFSIYNYVTVTKELQDIPNISYIEEYNVAKEEQEKYLQSGVVNEEKALELEKSVNKAYIKLLIFDMIIPYLWAVSVVFWLIIYGISYRTFSRKVKSSKDIDERLLKILNNCKTKLNINRKIEVVMQEYIKAPSIFGIFSIRILLNENVNQLSDNQIEDIFMHELGHYKRGDNLLNMIIVAIKAVYSFNPTIWMLCNQLRKDMELSTDQIATRNMDNNRQKEYCKTLVSLSFTNYKQFMVKALCLSNDRSDLKRRIDVIKSSENFYKYSSAISISAISIIIILSLVFYTNKMPNPVECTCGLNGRTPGKEIIEDEHCTTYCL